MNYKTKALALAKKMGYGDRFYFICSHGILRRVEHENLIDYTIENKRGDWFYKIWHPKNYDWNECYIFLRGLESLKENEKC